MKQEKGKTSKQRQSVGIKRVKPACGTLSYLSECRGVATKGGSMRMAPSDGIDKLVRK